MCVSMSVPLGDPLPLLQVGVLSRVQPGTRLQRWTTNLARGVTLIVVPVAAQLPSVGDRAAPPGNRPPIGSGLGIVLAP